MPSIVEREPVPGSEQWSWPDDTHPVVRQVLSRRPLGSVKELELELKHLTPVGRFDALSAAVQLLIAHRDRRVVIVGDFDADGATSAALMYLGLRAFGFREAEYFIPDRFELGYGLTPEVVRRLAPVSPSLIVTVDNGISSVFGVAEARGSGIDVLITDHHLPPAVLPDANVIVDPNLPGDSFAGKHLAGVGVAFYLMAALGRALGEPGRVAELLDLVALGTVADLVPLDHGNRILVAQGLRRIQAGRCRPGLRALCRVAGAELREVNATTLAYQVAPRLNAAGRLDDMALGVRCLTTDDQGEADRLADKLDNLNRDRRELEARMKAEAAELVDGGELLQTGGVPSVICLHHPEWHEGVVGLVASRIKETHHRPVVAFAPTGSGALKGSGRSIPGFHLRDALADVDAASPGLIERFGGHAMAAGLTLAADALPAFRAAMERLGDERLGPELLAQRILTDGELAPENMNVQVAALLRDAAPWGQAFPEPCFVGRFKLVAQRWLKEKHRKMTLEPVTAPTRLDGISFNCRAEGLGPGAELRLVYRLGVNEYFGPPKVQLIVDHIEA